MKTHPVVPSLLSRAVACALSVAACGAAIAAEAPAEVIVTAKPIIDGNVVDAQGAVSTVVTEEQLRDLNAIDLSAALRRTPGVTVSRFNPVGSFGGSEGGAVYVRGMGSSRPGSEIKTYIDGAPFYMGVWNHPLLDLLPVNGVQSITVHKGPQPQLFGNTFAAIDLATRRATEADTRVNVGLAGGSFSTFIEKFDVTGRRDGLDYAFAQSYARSDGHRDDADGKLRNAMGHVGYQWGDHWSAGLTALTASNSVYDPGELGLPATKTGHYDTKGTWGSLQLGHDYGWLSGSVQVYGNSGDGDWLNQPVDGNTLSHFNLSGLRWRETLKPWQGGEVSAGLDIDRISGSVDFNGFFKFDGPTLRVTSPYVGISQSVALGAGWTAVPAAGVRFYEHNVLASSTAPYAGLQFKSEGLDLRLSGARGINYPGLDAAVLSSLIAALGTSWRSLDPEQMDHLEIGMALRPFEATTIDLSLFKDKLKNRYIFAFPPAVAAPAFVNLGDYDVKGMEVTLQHQFGSSWDVFAGFTHLDSSLAQLPYAPKQSVSIGSNAVFGRFRVSADAQYQNDMYVLERARANGAVNSRQVDAFTVVNVRLAYSPQIAGLRSEVFLAIENLLDEDYAYRPGYPMPGTSGQIGVSVGW
ncbi:MAG: TonB-dependent receptor plug domain-containing protein [Steroidobacteraceae bacterium]